LSGFNLFKKSYSFYSVGTITKSIAKVHGTEDAKNTRLILQQNHCHTYVLIFQF